VNRIIKKKILKSGTKSSRMKRVVEKGRRKEEHEKCGGIEEEYEGN
jgi:hypothetical protein